MFVYLCVCAVRLRFLRVYISVSESVSAYVWHSGRREVLGGLREVSRAGGSSVMLVTA